MKSKTEQANEAVVKKYRHDNILKEDYFKSSSNVKIPSSGIFPLKIDNRQLCTPTEYQGDKPFCAGYSAAQLLESYNWKYTGNLLDFDAEQIYAKAKELDRRMDMGGTYLDFALRCALKLTKTKLLRDWFTVKTTRDKSKETVKRILHMNDLCVAGFNVDDSWYSPDPGTFAVSGNGKALGGHAVLVCGYDQSGVYIQNHWGREWGAKGFAVIPWNVYTRQFMHICWLAYKA